MTLFEASETNLPALASFLLAWAASEASSLPGAVAPMLSLRVEVEDAGTPAAVTDALAALFVRTSGASGAVSLATIGLPPALATAEAMPRVAAAIADARKAGHCPPRVGIAGSSDARAVGALASALDATGSGVRLATWHVPFAVGAPTDAAEGTLEACAASGVACVAEKPFEGLTGAGADPQVFKLLELVGQLSGGKTPGQVALAYPIARGAAVRTKVAADDGRGAWEAAGAMNWTLGVEERRVLEEKVAAR